MRKGWDKDMEQEKLYVIEEKTYEATSTRKFTSTG